jgi:serine/threonine protein kinase
VRLLDVLEEWGTDKNRIHCVFEFCESTLFSKLAKRHEPLKWPHIKNIMIQMLEAINILHGKMILHRDIKPENILIDKAGTLKLADFGLAKKASFLQRRKSNSIVSLWYRAPEIILGSEDYLLGVDIWSLGCLFGELMQTKPVYYCKSDEEVLDKAFRMMGTPSDTHCPFYQRLKKWHNFQFKSYRPPESLKQSFPYGTPEAIDLLGKMMNLDPKKRITAKEALKHPFFMT